MSNILYLLVGGEATRLKPLSEGIPKALLTVKDTPIIDLILQNLQGTNFDKFKLVCSIKHQEQWENYKSTSKFEVELLFENQKLDTAGYMIQNIDQFEESFFCMNGDLLLEMNFEKFLDHVGSVPNSTICSVQVDNPSRFGVLHLDKEKVVNFIEKPDDLKYGNNISMGFYYIVKEDILRIKESLPIPTSFEKDVFPVLAQNLLLNCYKVDGKMIDVGTIDSYIYAHTDGNGNWIGDNVVIGSNPNIKNSIIFENCTIGSDVVITNSIIQKDKQVPDKTNLENEIY